MAKPATRIAPGVSGKEWDENHISSSIALADSDPRTQNGSPSLDVVLKLVRASSMKVNNWRCCFLGDMSYEIGGLNERRKLRNQVTGEVLSMTRTVLILTSMIDLHGSHGWQANPFDHVPDGDRLIQPLWHSNVSGRKPSGKTSSSMG